MNNMSKHTFSESILLIISVMLVSCSNDTCKVDCQIGDSTDNISFSDYVDSIKTVSLCEDSIVLGDAKKIVKAQKYYYVLSQQEDAIIKCEERGEICTILRRLGHSKEEYTKILDYSIDETNETLVTLCAGSKLMVYDLSFNLKYVKELSLSCVSVCAFKGDIYCYSDKRQIVKVADQGLDVMLKGEAFPAYIYGLSPVFYKAGDKLFAVMEYDNTIYEIEDGELVPILTYSYPKQIKTIERMRKNDVMLEIEDIIEHSTVSVFNMELQQDRLAIIYSYDMLMRVCIIDINTKKLLSDGIIIGDFPKWISKHSCLGYADSKDFGMKYVEEQKKVIRVGNNKEDSNLIVEYYIHF